MTLIEKHTFLVENQLSLTKKHANRTKKFFKGREIPSIDAIFSKCRDRGDTCSEEICRKISLLQDLVVSKAFCYQQCKSNF